MHVEVLLPLLLSRRCRRHLEDESFFLSICLLLGPTSLLSEHLLLEALSRPLFDTLGCLAEVVSGSAHTDEEWGIQLGDFERALSDNSDCSTFNRVLPTKASVRSESVSHR